MKPFCTPTPGITQGLAFGKARALASGNAPRRSVPGFSLIELLVTISIIALIAGIAVPVAIKVMSSAEGATTRAMLNGLAGAADEYNVVTQSAVPHFGKDAFGNALALDVGQPEPNGGTGNDATLGQFIKVAGQVPTTAKLIAAAAKSNLKAVTAPDEYATIGDVAAAAGDPSVIAANIVILDGWDNPIRYAAGVNHNDAFKADDYLRAHPTPFFVSAGPDGLWGKVRNDNTPDESVDDDGDGEPDAADNIYSFDQDGLN